MKNISTISSLLVIGALSILASTWLTPSKFEIDLSEEETHLYL